MLGARWVERGFGGRVWRDRLSASVRTSRACAFATCQADRRLVCVLQRVLTLLCALFMLSYLDRANIGNAYTAGMATSLGLSPGQYQNLLTIFYVGYIVGQPCTVSVWAPGCSLLDPC